MFGNLGTHVIKFPSGRYGFVGTLPVTLATIVPATTSDVMGQRAFRNERGELCTYKFPVFDDEPAARQFAADKGVALAN